MKGKGLVLKPPSHTLIAANVHETCKIDELPPFKTDHALVSGDWCCVFVTC